MKQVIVVHGGAWAIPDSLAGASVAGVKRAARAGWTVLTDGSGRALDAVEEAVVSLEDDPAFDAGIGSVLTEDKDIEMDAMIMEGECLRAGSVACVHNVKNPVKLARQVMEKTEHVMLVGPGAERFAGEVGAERASHQQLLTPLSLSSWEEYTKYTSTVRALFRDRNGAGTGLDGRPEVMGHDTVGAVAIDEWGHVACATSTGGITAKKTGRVGDSPLIGCGGYCDDRLGAAVSCTGHGEAITKLTLARLILFHLEQGADVQSAVEKGLDHMTARVQGSGGAIAVAGGGSGGVGVHFTTERMAWASLADGVLNYGLDPGQRFSEPVNGKG